MMDVYVIVYTVFFYAARKNTGHFQCTECPSINGYQTLWTITEKAIHLYSVSYMCRGSRIQSIPRETRVL